ncbi:unnamed protein product (macronuclear) [Paramecium tetraurelia]|uniref:UBZ4-type domain-containing protein n=1 Tax=Paramecium tetraurelia TaxID=5888 RepID=A0CB08_PARTE|nr:uncharacterized protein GSPATT00036758001 [Paramecium tetraurelia]CAK67975.1 unnamed protein product [Paramecium tetraurelia]|eukprot:XP_001435372.1 hypothetical protein (macronuclear) [Paramecium tetraurelia strain d4-2]
MQTDYFSQRSAKPHSQSTKNLDQQYRAPKVSASTIYSVPCMNCENLIPINEIDQHTMKCLSVSKNVTAVLKSNRILDEINFKISKLRDSIQQLNAKESKQENSKYLIRADEMCEQIQTIQNNNQIEFRKLQDLNQELRTMTESYRGSLAIALYLERLHSLGLQKQTQLEKEIRTPRVDVQKHNINQTNTKQPSNVNGKQLGNNYNSQSQSSSYFFQQPSEYSRGSQLPSEQNRNSQLPPPSSFQNSPYGRPTIITKFSGSQDRSQMYDMKSEILTKISTSQLDESEANQNDSDLNNSNQQNQQQRIFYSKCLAQKTKLPNTHPSQKIPLCILHKEMLQRKIPSSMWDKFILDALNNPHQYLDMNKVQNTQGLKNQLRSMTQEHQFKQRIHNI